nr:hypothetical protein [Candidatus Njordarchaeota archaeon]
MSEPESENNLSDEDIEKAIVELRYVFKNAAQQSPLDWQLVMDLTKTFEDLTEMRINKANGWDPRLGGVIQKIEEAETKLGIQRPHRKKQIDKPKKKGLNERVKFWKDKD